MNHLSDQDRKLIEEFIKNGVLEPLNGYQLDYSNGVIMVACSDGDQLYDLISRHTTLCRSNPNHTRIHLIALNGGALLLSNIRRQLHEPNPARDVILNHLEDARKLTRITSVALYSHAPCDIAEKYGLDVFTIILSLIGAFSQLTVSEGFNAACFLHVCYNENQKESYHISIDKFNEYLRTI